MPADKPIRSSVPLQMLLYYNSFFSPCFFLLSLAIFFYKGASRRHRPPFRWRTISRSRISRAAG